ncbi:hypothetical protein SRABI106_04617 [Rahnella aquatilis]|nr:hypothetical protein SRABI106_04617 [Rahnella aquatilis]
MRAKAFAGMLLAQNLAADPFTPHIFANGDKFHLRCDDAFAGVMQLRDIFTRNGFARARQVFEAEVVQPVIRQPLLSKTGTDL